MSERAAGSHDDALESRLRAALATGAAPAPVGDRDAVVRAVRRGHARRRALAGGLALVVAAAVLLPVFGLGRSAPTRLVAAPERGSSTDCVLVRVGVAPARCAGRPEAPTAAATSGAAASAAAPQDEFGVEAPPVVLRVRAGQHLTVTLPTGAGLTWSAPVTDASPTADQAANQQLALGVVVPGARPGEFVATHPGHALLRAQSQTTCTTGACPAGPVWQVEVVVRPAAAGGR